MIGNDAEEDFDEIWTHEDDDDWKIELIKSIPIHSILLSMGISESKNILCHLWRDSFIFLVMMM